MRKLSKSGLIYDENSISYKGFDLGLKRAEFRVKKKTTFYSFFKKNILELISLVVKMDSKMKLIKDSNFFWEMLIS